MLTVVIEASNLVSCSVSSECLKQYFHRWSELSLYSVKCSLTLMQIFQFPTLYHTISQSIIYLNKKQFDIKYKCLFNHMLYSAYSHKDGSRWDFYYYCSMLVMEHDHLICFMTGDINEDKQYQKVSTQTTVEVIEMHTTYCIMYVFTTVTKWLQCIQIMAKKWMFQPKLACQAWL